MVAARKHSSSRLSRWREAEFFSLWMLGAASLCLLDCREQRAPSASPGPAHSTAPAPAARPSAAAERASPAPLELEIPIDVEKLRKHVERIAKPRPPGSSHWKRVQNLCADAFRAAGLTVELQDYGTGVNVVGVRAKGDARPARVVVSAHYDHIARCAGADDNASGVAALLEIVRSLGKARYGRTFVAACWDEEERGLIGSRAYSDRAKSRSEPIVVALSLDAIGYASKLPGSQRVPAGFELAFPRQAGMFEARSRAGDFIVAVSNPPARALLTALRRHASAETLPLIDLELSSLHTLLMRDAYRSDHASFWLNDYPGVLLTDTANFRNPGYHCGAGADTPETLDYSFLQQVTKTAALATLELLEPEP